MAQRTSSSRRTREVRYTAVAENRGRERIWLEGRRLAASGFQRGTRYRVEVNPERGYARFVIDANGDRVVSGRKRKGQDHYTPIIDICLCDLAPAGTRIRAVLEDGRIEITIHHEEVARLDRERRLRRALRGGRLAEASVCTGIGVSTAAIKEGLEREGVRGHVEWVAELDGRYLEVADRNNPAITPATRLFNASIEEIEPHLLTPVDLLSFSLPCDGHSLAERCKGRLRYAEDHESGTSVFGLLRILDAANPSVLISENVVQARDSATYTMLRGELRRRGYLVQDVTLGPEQAGTLEARKRWFFVALSKGVAEAFDIQAVQPEPRIHRAVRDILDHVPDDDPSWSDNTYLKEKSARDLDAGKNFGKRCLLRGDEERTAVIGKYYWKRRSTEPFVARDDGRERLLTPAEHARAKGIPEELVRDVVMTIAHEGLGQSGLWGHFYGLARLIGRHLQSLEVTHDGAVIEGAFGRPRAHQNALAADGGLGTQGELFSEPCA